MENGIPPWQMQCPNNKQETKSNQIQRVRIIAPTARYSDGPLFRRPIIPTTHYSDSPLL
jgi:hypothetical protein